MFSLVPFRMNALDRSLWNDLDMFPTKMSSFKTDITENDQEYMLEADLPGFNKEAIQLEMADNCLTIRAKKDDTSKETGDNYLRKERFWGEMSRSFIFEDVKEEEIKAEFKDGVLKVVLPKKEPVQNKVRKIELT